jgi:hypothetical protein
MSPLMPKVITNDWQYASSADITDTTAVEVQAAPGATQRNFVVAAQFTNSDATIGTVVQILSGSTVIGNAYVGPQIATTGSMNGYGLVFPKPLKGGLNEAINVKCVTDSAQVRVSVQGFTATA